MSQSDTLDERLEQRLQKLETQVAYHEAAADDATKVIYALEQRVATLEGLVKVMTKQLGIAVNE